MRVLFLDIDGVLNSGAYFQKIGHIDTGLTTAEAACERLDPRAIDLLNELVRGDVKPVITSHWRKRHSLREIGEYFRARGFLHHIFCKTADIDGDAAPRSLEIAHWLGQHHGHVESFAIVDDKWDAGLGLDKHFVRTDWWHGLQPAHVATLRSMLFPNHLTNAA